MELIDFQRPSVVPGLYLASDPVGVGQDGHAEIDCSPFTISQEGDAGMDCLMVTICHVGPINCSSKAVRHSVTISRKKVKGDDCPTLEEILPESWENKILWCQ